MTRDSSTSSGDTPPNPEEHVLIGRIVRAVGLQGWVKIAVLTDFPDRLAPGREILVGRPGQMPHGRRMVAVKPTSGDDFLDLLLEGVPDRDAAQLLVGSELLIPRQERRTPEPDAFYPDELAGMSVIDRSGNPVAVVQSLMDAGPAPYLVLRDDQAREILVPFRKVFLLAIDRETRTIRLAGNLADHLPT